MKQVKVFLVREAESYVLAGIFWARDPATLWDLVDEMGGPAFFEYAELGPGGLFTYEPIGTRPPVPQRGDELDDESAAGQAALTAGLSLANFEFAESTLNDVTEMDALRWRRFDPADEGVGAAARAVRGEL